VALAARGAVLGSLGVTLFLVKSLLQAAEEAAVTPQLLVVMAVQVVVEITLNKVM
jgi:hypothetical protein